VGDWYAQHYAGRTDMYAYTLDQIDEYETLARERRRIWAVP
jgi:hypothetical protein